VATKGGVLAVPRPATPYGLDLVSATDNNGVRTCLLQDGLSDGSGSVTDTYAYDAFGAVKTHTGSSANEWRFAGESPICYQVPPILR
jgi:hypothetical protein